MNMEIKEIKNEKLDREILVTIVSSEMEDLYSKKLEESCKVVRLQGFRPGKAPKSTVEQRYGDSIYSELLDEQVNNSSREVLKDFKIFGQPKLLDFQGKRGSDVLFKLAFEVYPQVDIPDFKKITVKRPVIAKIEQELIEKRKKDIVSGYFDKEPVEDEDAKTQEDDMMIAEFNLLLTDVEDDKSDGGQINNKHGVLYINLGQNSHKYLDSEAESKMINRKINETFDVNKKIDQEFVDFYFKDDANYQTIKDLTENELKLEIKVSKIMRKNIKELDEELSSQIFGCALSEVDTKVEKFIEDDFAEMAFSLSKIELFNELEKILTFEVPRSIYEKEYSYLCEQMKNDLESDKLKSLSEDQLKESAERIALRRIRIGLMLTEYASLNKINVTDNDIRLGMLEKIKEFPSMANQIVQYYNTDKAALNSLIASVLENKAAKHIIEKEVSVEEEEYTYEKLTEVLQKETEAVFSPHG